MASNPTVVAAVTERLQDWRQGDAFLTGDLPFTHIAKLDEPITLESQTLAEKLDDEGDPLAYVSVKVPGFAVITQTCDLVRPCNDRALVLLAPLAVVEPKTLLEVKQGYRPRFIFIPGLEDKRLVADLDAVMTVEKSILDGSKRVPGCRNDQEEADFSAAVARNLTRKAFPDNFVSAVSPIRDRLKDKHGKQTRDKKNKPTNEGKFYSDLREIRVAASPNWNGQEVTVTFYFIVPSRDVIPSDAETIVEDLMDRFKPVGSFIEADFRIVSLDEMPASVYVASSPLDLDNLSRKK